MPRPMPKRVVIRLSERLAGEVARYRAALSERHAFHCPGDRNPWPDASLDSLFCVALGAALWDVERDVARQQQHSPATPAERMIP